MSIVPDKQSKESLPKMNLTILDTEHTSKCSDAHLASRDDRENGSDIASDSSSDVKHACNSISTSAPSQYELDAEIMSQTLRQSNHGCGAEAEDRSLNTEDATVDSEIMKREHEEFILKEIGARDQKIADLELAYRSALRDRDLAKALVGKPLVTGAADQLIKLWREDFDVYLEDGEFKIAARDGRSIAEAVAERLASSEYAHFCNASSRGGTGARDANHSASAPGGFVVPRNLGEAIILRWREMESSEPKKLSSTIGLGKRR